MVNLTERIKGGIKGSYVWSSLRDKKLEEKKNVTRKRREESLLNQLWLEEHIDTEENRPAG